MASASLSPSVSPSVSPSSSPSLSPSVSPSSSPSVSPSRSPSASPSVSPSPVPAGKVTYTLHKRVRLGKMHMCFTGLALGGSLEAYPLGGIPLSINSLGLTATVSAVIILESNADVYLYEYDVSANTIRMFSEQRVEVPEGTYLPASIAIEVVAIGY